MDWISLSQWTREYESKKVKTGSCQRAKTDVNMKVEEVIPIVVGVLEQSQGLHEKTGGIRNQGLLKTINTTVLLRLARILRRVLETCYHSTSRQNQSVDAGVKILQSEIIIIKNNPRNNSNITNKKIYYNKKQFKLEKII